MLMYLHMRYGTLLYIVFVAVHRRLTFYATLSDGRPARDARLLGGSAIFIGAYV